MADKIYTGQATFADTTSDVNRTEFIMQQMLNQVATATLVTVKAVDAEAGTVDIEPMVAQLDGAGNAIPHGTIFKAPFFMPRAGESAVMLVPAVGDIGLAIFCHNDISAAKRAKKPSNPGSRRRFSWSDALYLGGFLGPEPTQFIRLDDDGITIQAGEGKPVTLSSSDKIALTGPVDTDTEYRVAGVKVIGEQQAAITGPTGGATTDAQSRTAIGSIIAAMRAHGLIA